MNLKWFLPTKIIFGAGSIKKLAMLDIVQNSKGTVLICDGSAIDFGVADSISKMLNCEVKIYKQSSSNPTIANIETAIKNLSDFNFDIIIAVGGGSTMDLAKGFCNLKDFKNVKERIRSGEKYLQRETKLIAIPTTAGTGSEVTPYATIWDIEEQKKHSVAGPASFPDVALIDPELTLTVPKNVTAYTALDTFSHALEAYWNTNANEATDALALKSISLTRKYIKKVYEDGSNIEYRTGMAKACLIAGMAFSQTATAAAHAISYPLTLRYGIPHGLACSITLPALMKKNVAAMKEKVNPLMDIFKVSDVNSLCVSWREMFKSIDVKNLTGYKANPDEYPAIAKQSYNPARMKNNPVMLKETDIVEILNKS